MKRREFITLLGGAAVSSTTAQPLIAQEAGRTYRLGGLHLSSRNAPWHVALFEELQRRRGKTFWSMRTDMDCASRSLRSMHRRSSRLKSMSSFARGMQPPAPHSRPRKPFRFSL